MRKAILDAALTKLPPKGARTKCDWTLTRTRRAAPRPFCALGENSRQSNWRCIRNTRSRPSASRAISAFVRNELLLTNGGDDALRVFFDTFVDAGSHILICEPTFPMYRYYAEIAGARIEVLRYDREMEFPLEACPLRAAQKTSSTFYRQSQQSDRHARHRATRIEKILARPRTRGGDRRSLRGIFRGHRRSRGFANIRISSSPAHFQRPPDSPACASAQLWPVAIRSRILRRAMPPFPVNLAALVAAEAAVAERSTMRGYVSTVKRLRAHGSQRN